MASLLLAEVAGGQLNDATARALTAARALRMATAEGARAIGRPETGSIEVGKRADLITVEARQPHLAPLFDPEKALVYSARGADVRDAVIDGRVVMRDRKLLTVDECELLKEAERVARRCAALAGVKLPTTQPTQTPKPQPIGASSDTRQSTLKAAAISATRRIITHGPQA